jgi:membrane-bound metal-dependent hydrolase YbcI (DUF457 family)
MKRILIIFLLAVFYQSDVYAQADNQEHFSLDFIPEDFRNVRGFIFGITHTGLLVIGYYTGWSVNRFLKVISNGYIAGLFGALMAHVITDLISSIVDPSIRPMTFGIFLGGITPFIFIPLLEKYVVKSKHHIVIGDHDDVKKDLENKHNH